jgi:hypothetical protein
MVDLQMVLHCNYVKCFLFSEVQLIHMYTLCKNTIKYLKFSKFQIGSDASIQLA